MVLSRPFVPDEQLQRLARGDHLDVVIVQHITDCEPWLSVAAETTEDGALIMSMESAERLAHSMSDAVALMRR